MSIKLSHLALCIAAFWLLHLRGYQAEKINLDTSKGMEELNLSDCSQGERPDDSTCAQVAYTGGPSTTWNCFSNDNGTCWWRAVLKQRAHIELINIYSSPDCCEGGHDFVISIDGVECAAYRSSDSFTKKSFNCGVTGQVIQISAVSSRLVLKHVDALGQYMGEDENLGLSRCSQGSTENSQTSCDKAIDGDLSQMFFLSNCSIAGSETGWWRAETSRRVYFKRILIFLVTDLNGAPLFNNISINLSISVDSVTCTSYKASGLFTIKAFNCYAIGSVIEISMVHYWVPLCEVRAYGEYIDDEEKLHLTKCSSQNSAISDGESSCYKAIDGNPDQQPSRGSCYPVESAAGWWRAQTAYRSYVKKIRVYTAEDTTDSESPSQARSLKVKLDSSECFVHEFSDELTVKMFHCYSIGSQIVISSDSPDIALCEVQVFGEYAVIEEPLSLTNCTQGGSSSSEHSCERALDGRANASAGIGCAQVTQYFRAWWNAMLSRKAHVSRVLVSVWGDDDSHIQPTEYQVYMSGKVCDSYGSSKTNFVARRMSCWNVVDTNVVVVSWNASLVLCGVQAFGKYVTDGRVRPLSCDQSSSGNPCTWALENNISNAKFSVVQATNLDMQSKSHPWWMAKLPRKVFVRRVELHGNSSANSPVFRFAVSLDGIPCDFYINVGTKEGLYPFPCYKIGQEVNIASTISKVMTLWKVQVLGEYVYRSDILPLVACKQSATLDGNSTYSCDRATDSNVTSNIASDTCSRLDSDLGWWQAEVEVKSHIRWIRIYNMINSSSVLGFDSLNDIVISVDGVQCASYQSDQRFIVKNFYCDTIGKTVRITSRKPYMELCGVQVIGDTFFEQPEILKTAECRPNKTYSSYECEMSSNDHERTAGSLNCSFKAYYSPDTDKDANMRLVSQAHNSYTSSSWLYIGFFQVMTYRPAYIRRVVITPKNPGNWLHNFAITVDDKQCASYRSRESFVEKSFDCNLGGVVVNIVTKDDYKIEPAEVTLIGEYMLSAKATMEMHQQPFCTRAFLRKRLKEDQ